MKDCALAQLIVPGTDQDVVDAYSTLAQRSTDAVFGFEEEVCVLDVETTGFDPYRDRLIEIGAAIMRGPEVVARFTTFVDPLVPIPVEISKLTGIDQKAVEGAPCAEAAVESLIDFIDGRTIIAHNVAFDRSFIEAVCGQNRIRGPWLDSLTVLRIALPRLRSHRLQDLAEGFEVMGEVRPHRAGADVEMLCRLWRIALVGLSDLPHGLLRRLADLAPEVEWPERQILAHMAAAAPTAAYDLKELRRVRVAQDRAPAMQDADEMECECPSAREVTDELTAGGLAGRMYDTYEQRAEQIEMAKAIVSAFETSTHAAIEAGTGVGKSLAYLVPAALFSEGNSVGVGVATKTNALMDQLVYHELPRLNAALGGGLRYVALKGYDHYLCLRKLEKTASAASVGTYVEQLSTLAMLLSWASQSSWGDLDTVNLHWRKELRSEIQSTQADCTFKHCRYYPSLCYLHGVRKRATSSNIVVTNHALLFRDVVAQGAILPPIRHWIVDEAHAVESEARKQLTMGASCSELNYVLGALYSGRSGALENVRRKLGHEAEGTSTCTTIATMQAEIKRTSVLAGSLFEFVKDLSVFASEGDYDSAELWVNEEVRDSGPWGVVASTGRSLAKRLDKIIRDGRDLMTSLEELGADFAEMRADVAGLLSRLAEQYMGLLAVVDGADDRLVYSAALDRRAQVPAEKLLAARLDVGEVLADDLYPRVHSVIYTSATIATGESFKHFARSVGLDRLPDDMWKTLKLSSSYDFERQMSVFVPTGFPEPANHGYLQSLEELLEGVHLAMGGSVLTLFTNRRDMERLHAVLEPRLRAKGLDLIVQRRGTSAKRLRDEFLADERLSLFALKSFWEGFDAKGDTLRCVVVPKLPFGRPTDPLSKERERREGSVAWRRYALPEAVLELKQAAGRLIRSSTDTGCLVLADARVLTKNYGREFLGAMPVADIERLSVPEIVTQIEQRFGR